ncbi:MAG: hypothetical protein O3B31_08735 [Chloroflexi bacterium]|nr:hypothetical protein [Chloroflexota bacterium]MDA1003412.1 hypothetical protein [Chloroflexota bacterium]MQC27807.1 hypothetical protein [Chloroflexota bacterium]
MASITCTDSAGGLTQGPIAGAGTGSASVALSVSGGGDHVITCSATDGAMPPNTGAADGSENVAVVRIDATAPTCTATASPSSIWPPNKKLVPVTVTVTVSDAQSGAGAFTLVSATSNEPNPGNADIQNFTIGAPDTAGSLRADRLGGGSGRVYTLTYAATDAARNTGTCAATVTVPHDQGH